EEAVDRGPAPQGRDLLDLAALHVVQLDGRGEHGVQGPVVQVGDAQQVATHHRSPPAIVTESATPSWSSSRTVTRSACEVGRFLPTWSARIGSSRWPRSTRTARRTTRGRP